MDLAIAVKKYLEMAGEFGKAVHLSGLGLPRAEVQVLVNGRFPPDGQPLQNQDEVAIVRQAEGG